ncbi:hypothetical protein CBOM_06321 [Ceraceosorus bombacis]|uniref:Uncharacterized protein n=1 Tax=Ceraceosorus bombacis TaxID=401625 RepID=A0A0P1BQV1_9BASI|nr:hypothetical protein CBOM_06321 [Ceraceosorus bombacis]
MQFPKVVLVTLAIAAAWSRAQPIPSQMSRPIEKAPVEDLAEYPTLGLSALQATSVPETSLFGTGAGIGVPFYAKKEATRRGSVKEMRKVLAGNKPSGKAKENAKEYAQKHKEEEGETHAGKH